MDDLLLCVLHIYIIAGTIFFLFFPSKKIDICGRYTLNLTNFWLLLSVFVVFDDIIF